MLRLGHPVRAAADDVRGGDRRRRSDACLAASRQGRRRRPGDVVGRAGVLRRRRHRPVPLWRAAAPGNLEHPPLAGRLGTGAAAPGTGRRPARAWGVPRCAIAERGSGRLAAPARTRRSPPRRAPSGTWSVRLDPRPAPHRNRLARTLGPNVTARCHHHQALARVAAELDAVGWRRRAVEAVEMRGRRFVVGVQWHPEETSPSCPVRRVRLGG